MPKNKTETLRSRCANGSRKNRKTNKCVSVLDNKCAICLDRIISGNVKTKCKHNFHKRCLIGWCQKAKDNPTCPICRKNIKDTCVKITPFDSQEVFRYVNEYNDSSGDRIWKQQKMTGIINNKNFDVNVKAPNGVDSILYVLSHNRPGDYLALIDDLLQNPSVKVSPEFVGSLSAQKRTKVLQLLKKWGRLPKGIDKLM